MYEGHDPEAKKTKHMACVTCMDAAIGQILDELREHDLEQNTLVLFFSDNGGSGIADNGPLRGRKAQMWEGGLRVPCIARYPGKLPEGTVNDSFLTALEVLPTIAAVSGADLPRGRGL